jgi:lysyl-tRNA synthetase class 2
VVTQWLRRYGSTDMNADAPEPPEAAPAPEPAELTGSGLAAEKARRLARVAELRDRGLEPYPYRFDRTHTLNEVRQRWGELEAGTETDAGVAVAGRVMLKRDSGKLVFATIRDRSGDIQLFVSQAVVGEDAFADVKALDLGDWVGVEGTVMTTRKGELSVKVAALTLLS